MKIQRTTQFQEERVPKRQVIIFWGLGSVQQAMIMIMVQVNSKESNQKRSWAWRDTVDGEVAELILQPHMPAWP